MTSDDIGLPQSPAQAAEGSQTRWMDRKDDLSDAIEASHPLKTGRHDLYQRAMELVGNRHSKGGLVCLVNHLLAEADSLRAALSAEGSATIAAARKQAAEEMRERAAKVAEAQPFFPDTHTGMRQQWVKDQIAASIRGLAAASPFQTEEAKEQ